MSKIETSQAVFLRAVETLFLSFLFRDTQPEKLLPFLTQEFQKGTIKIMQYRRQEVIYSPTCYEKSLGILIKGKAIAEKGHGVLLNTFSPGDCFGVAALFGDTGVYVATVKAVADSTILFLPLDSMRQLFELESQIAVNYILFLSNRIHFLNCKIDNFTAGAASQNLLTYLQAQAPPGQKTFTLPVSMAKLSEMLNIGRSSLYRGFQSLEEQGLIQKNGKVITLLR